LNAAKETRIMSFDHRFPYSPPGVYTQTNFETSVGTALSSLNIPVLIGPGNELLTNSIEVVRGSSASSDQRIPLEDMAGRAVMEDGSLSDFNESARFIKVRNYPIVKGDGRGTASTSTSDVVAFIDNEPIVVLSVDGENGLVELATSPTADMDVRCTYFFNRMDTSLSDDVSDQVSTGLAELIGSLGEDYTITTTTNTFLVSIDGGDEIEIEIPAQPEPFTAAQIAARFTAAVAGLTATAETNNEGASVLVLQADQSIEIGLGTMNTEIGFSAGQSTSRNTVFWAKQAPLVTGDNSGTATTNPSHVAVEVDGIAVGVAAVDGATGAITLAVAPAADAAVQIAYSWNSWQDTFDYLANIGVQEVVSCGIAVGYKSYTQGTDFVLKDDKLLWGTAFTVAAGESTEGSVVLDDTQVSGMLVDQRCFFKECFRVTDTSVTPAVTSSTTFQLPYVATTGDGLNNEISANLYATIANSRRDLPTNRPELVKAYWGFDVQDAMDRGEVAVVRVDGAAAQVTLAEGIPSGANLYATFYHSRMTDTGNSAFAIACASEGSSGAGTYSVTDPNGDSILIAAYDDKGAGLVDTVQFPSGNETQPRAYHQGGTPVEEDVTLTFETRDSTPAEISLAGPGPYYFVQGSSDTLSLAVNGGGWVGAAVLSDPFQATLWGGKVTYDASADHLSWTLVDDEAVTVEVDGVSITATVSAAAGLTVQSFADALNTAAKLEPIVYTSAGKFSSSTVVAAKHDTAEVIYTDDAGAQTYTATLTAGAYATPALLAAEVQTQLQLAALTAEGGPGNEADTPTITVDSNAFGQMVIGFQSATNNNNGVLTFSGDQSDDGNFWVLAGVDCNGANSIALVDGPIAGRWTQAGDGTENRLEHDRILLRNRIKPVGFVSGRPQNGSVAPEAIESQCYIKAISGSDLSRLNLEADQQADAGCCAVVQPATLLGDVGWRGGQSLVSAQPQVIFYDGTEAGNSQNDTLAFNFDGNPVAVVFASAGGGTATDLGPVEEVTSISGQIIAAIVAQTGYSAAADVITAGVVMQEGAALRISSVTGGSGSSVSITEDSGNAHADLGLESSASRTAVAAGALAGAIQAAEGVDLNMQGIVGDSGVIDFAGGYGALALALAQSDDAGAETVFLATLSHGTASNIACDGGNAILSGSGLLVEDGEGAVGEAGRSGFIVSSSNPNGSGSANDSLLSAGGGGSDGVVGQTYTDSVTGLTFTILERDGAGNYDTGATATYNMTVRGEGVCDANNPVTAIPGLWTWVANTAGVEVGDTVSIETYKRGANEKEPANNQSYYVTYTFQKRDFTPKIFTKLQVLEDSYGATGPDAPVSLASYLMMLNGAGAIGVKQVLKTPGQTNAPESSYLNAIDELEGMLPGGIRPALLLPLVPASLDMAQYLSEHCTIQSDIAHHAERTTLLGFSAGTQPSEAAALVSALNGGAGDWRVRFMYPDMMTVTTTDYLGNDTESLIDGRYLACMMAARQLSSNRDVATPWTGTRLVGTNGLARKMDAVAMNQVASAGISVCENKAGMIQVRHGLSSDMTDVLTKTPTVVQIVDLVQQSSRAALQNYIGVKFLPGILSQLEGNLCMMFQRMIAAQIVTNYTGVKATVSSDDPTLANMEAFYQPVFPLLYIVLNFNLRSQL
jgi:hypothetical protein